jgi:hypothetical protein
VVWRPSSGTPANPQGAPLASELVIFCPDPAAPSHLVELTVPADSSTLPVPTSSTFKSYIDALKTESGVQKTLLTDLMHTDTDPSNVLRGCVRFVVTVNPSYSDINSYRSGTTAWASVPWAQGVWSSNSGMRQVWARTELQLMPAGAWLVTNIAAKQPVPFFGSAANYYEVLP